MATQITDTAAEVSQLITFPGDRITVTIPDFFVNFASEKPRVNKLYEQVRKESVDWLCK
jgi:hypothetical protein